MAATADAKKRSREAPEPSTGMRRITTRLEGVANEDLMMQIDQEEKKEEGVPEFKRTNTGAQQAMSMRPKSVGAQELLVFKGPQVKPRPAKNIRPPEMDRGTEINKAGEVDE